jgi:hypothetical protein
MRMFARTDRTRTERLTIPPSVLLRADEVIQ